MTSSRSRSPECWIDAGKIARSALAASAPETGEREAVTEALLQWAASPEEDWLYWDFEEQKYFCAFCGNTNLHYREVIHTDSCLHLRAKALRAQAGVEGAG